MNAKILILFAMITLALSASCSDETRDDCASPKAEHVETCCAHDPTYSYCNAVEDMDIDLPVSDMGGDDGPVEDMPEVDMPEDEGQPDQSTPCDSACGGQTPICDVATDTCVQCLNNNECANSVCDTSTKSCVECLGDEDCDNNQVCLTQASTEDNACVECRGNAECLDAQASLCSAANECAPCAADADCSHLEELGQCVAGTCRECTTDTENADCGGNVCDPSTFTCTNIQIANTGDLDPCITDTQCANGLCIALNYMGSPHGNYCMPLSNGPGSCPQPYGAGIANRTSVTGVQGSVCMINEALTTPEAIRLYKVESCDAADPTAACPEPGQICAIVDDGGTTKCTHRCGTQDDCKLPGTTCFSPLQGDDYCR